MAIKLLTAAQVVEFFHERGLTDFDVKWVKRRCDKGDIPYTVVSHRRRIRSDVVQRIYEYWLKSAM